MTAFNNYAVSTMADSVAIPAFSVTSATNLFSLDTTGFLTLVVQVTGAGTGNTWTSECSEDGTTWASTPMQIGLSGSSTTTGTTASIYLVPVVAKFHRLRVSTYGSGTITGIGHLRNTFTLGQTNTAAASPTFTRLTTPNNTSTPSSARIFSAAGVNATSVVTGAKFVSTILLANTTASWRYFKLYSKASAPTVGTDTPLATVGVPPNGSVMWESLFPLQTPLGLAYAITGGVTDADTTVVAAGDVTGFIIYS